VARLACAGLPAVVVNSLVNAPYTAERLADPAVRRWRYRLVQVADMLTARLLVDRFHAVSESVAAAAERTLRVPRSRITVIGRGRDPGRLGLATPERRRAVRERLGIDDRTPVVSSIGRQDYQKGQELLVRALAQLRSPALQPLLLVAGREGNASATVASAIADTGAESWVRLLGHRDDVPDLLAASDVFAFPSRFEGYPGAVLEAFALGVPVVASDIGPVREIVEDGRTGLLARSGDVASLRAALARVLGDGALARALGDNAARAFREHHTIETVAARMIGLYHELAASRA
jgi:glycosyltransferase involved in cell wall biosynthesis